MYDQIQAAVLLNKMKKRVNGMKSIDEALDLGGGLSVVATTEVVTEFSDSIDLLHKLEADVERMRVKIDTMSGRVRDLNQRILSGVGARFGFDSDAYQQVGGKRRSQRKKPARKKKGVAAAKDSRGASMILEEGKSEAPGQSTTGATAATATATVEPGVKAEQSGRQAAVGGQTAANDISQDKAA